MLHYTIRRGFLAVVIVFCVLLVLFSLTHLMPGDPISIALGPRATPEVQARYAARLGLDLPIWAQFLLFLENAVRGDLGVFDVGAVDHLAVRRLLACGRAQSVTSRRAPLLRSDRAHAVDLIDDGEEVAAAVEVHRHQVRRLSALRRAVA